MIRLSRLWSFRNHPETEEAKRHLDASVGDRPAVEALVQQLREQQRKNHFAQRLAKTLEGE